MTLATDLIADFPDDDVTTSNNNLDTENMDNSEETDTSIDDVKDNTQEDTKSTEEYFADDDDDEIVETPKVEAPSVPSNFSAEDKYIIDNLPMISVRVIMADDSVKTMQVRSAAELPRDMKGIATPYEDKQFDLANAAQENRARELQTYYRQNQSQVQSQEYERQENASIREDINELQHNGDIPTFKVKPGARGFDDDPAALIINEVIEFMNDRNEKYLEKSKQGSSYRHIGFAEAYELMNGKSKDNSKNSSTRKDAANKLLSHQGGSSNKNFKAPVSGRTIKDVAAEFDDFEV